MGDAIAALRRRSTSVRFLGSFPKADGVASVVQAGSEDADFAEAQAWLEEVRNGRAG